MEIKIGVLSVKILVNRTYQNHYLDSRCTLTAMTPEMMSRPISGEKNILNK